MKTTPLIYVVDDSKLNLLTLKEKIRSKIDCRVRTFEGADECLRMIELRKPTLILADYMLDSSYSKTMNGDELLRIVQFKFPDVPVIMYSSKESVDVVVDLMKTGAVDFVKRDDRFIRKIETAVLRQLDELKDRAIEKRVKWMFLALGLLLIAGYLLVNFLAPDFILPYIVGSIFIALLLFIGGAKIQLKSKYDSLQ